MKLGMVTDLRVGDWLSGPAEDRPGAGSLILCPGCKGRFNHIIRVGTMVGSGQSRAYPGTEGLGTTPHSGNALAIVFECEFGHYWELRIQHHEGEESVQISLLSDTPRN